MDAADPRTVVTYALAYGRTSITLCAMHATPEQRTNLAALGHVQHGARKGYCDACEQEYLALIDADAGDYHHPDGCSCGSPDCPQWQADHIEREAQ